MSFVLDMIQATIFTVPIKDLPISSLNSHASENEQSYEADAHSTPAVSI